MMKRPSRPSSQLSMRSNSAVRSQRSIISAKRKFKKKPFWNFGLQQHKKIARLILSLLEDVGFNGPSLMTQVLYRVNLDWNNIIKEKYTNYGQKALLNHLKRSFVKEIMHFPRLNKYQEDTKALFEYWKVHGGCVLSDRNLLLSSIQNEDLQIQKKI